MKRSSELRTWVLLVPYLLALLLLGIRLGVWVVDQVWPPRTTLLEQYRDRWPGTTYPNEAAGCILISSGNWYLEDTNLVTYCVLELRSAQVKSAGVYVTDDLVTKLVLSTREVLAGELQLSWGRPLRTWRWHTTMQLTWGNGAYALARRYGSPTDYSPMAEVILVVWAWSPPH